MVAKFFAQQKPAIERLTASHVEAEVRLYGFAMLRQVPETFDFVNSVCHCVHSTVTELNNRATHDDEAES
jgi:hypothetical protein